MNSSEKKSSSSKPQNYRSYLWGVLVWSLLGVAASVYATWHHIEYQKKGATEAVCNIDETWSCDDIAASEYSELWGIPMGIWGLGYFISLLGLALILLPKKPLTSHVGTHLSALVVLSGVGVLVSVVLGSISFFIIEAFCLTCTVVYVLNFLLGAWSLWALLKGKFKVSLWKGPHAPWSGLMSAAILVAITVAAYSQIGGKPAEVDLGQEIANNPEQTNPNDTAPPPLHQEDVDGSDPLQNPFLAQVLSSKVHDIHIDRSPFSGFGEDYRAGNDQASVVLVEFADFQCSACAVFSETLAKIKEIYADRVNIIFKNYPIDSSCNRYTGAIHPQACETAILARCAGLKGKFWEYHDQVFPLQKNLKAGAHKVVAKELGLDEELINNCLESADLVDKIKHDIELGTRLGIRATPSIYINGREYYGAKDLATLSQVLDLLLSAS